MMYTKLVKVFLKENFSLKRLLGTNIQKNKGKAILLGFALLYAFGSYLFGFGFLFFDLAKTMDQLNVLGVVVMYSFTYSMGLVMLFTLFRSNGYMFHYKDYEILSPLPIKPFTVLMAKVTIMMIMVYFTIFIFTLPITFAYFYFAGFNVISFLFYILGLLMVPLLPTIVFSLISLGIARLTSGFRGSKVLTTVLLFVVFLFIMYLSFSFNADVANPFLGQQQFIESLGNVYPPLQWFVEAVHLRDPLSMLFLLVGSIVPFGAYLYLIRNFVQKTNQKGMSIKTRRNAKPAKSQTRSLTASLISKEANKYMNVPIYALNTGFGPVILLILGIASMFFKSQIEGFLQEITGTSLSAELLVILIIGFCVGMLYTPAISLSLEGKNFWILKSLPVDPKKVMFSKALFNVILGLPVALVALILFSITFGFSFVNTVVIAFFAASFSFSTSMLDSIINLYFPKFEYLNETEVVKQSVAALLGMLGNLSLLALGGVFVYLLFDVMSWQLLVLFASIINLGLFFLFAVFIRNRASALFRKMPA